MTTSRFFQSKNSEFFFLAFFMILTRLSDLYVTKKYSPDLKFEANPLISFLKLHWSTFLLCQFLLTLGVILCLYYDLFSSRTKYPEDKSLPFHDFAPIHWFGRKRHPIFFLLAFAKDWDLRIKFLGYSGSRLLILIGVIATMSWVGLANSQLFERFYNFCFPIFPYGFLVIGALLLLYLFLKKEFSRFQNENIVSIN